MLLGRLGQHHQALTIFTLILGEVDKALEYCHKHYVPHGNGSEVSSSRYFTSQTMFNVCIFSCTSD